MEPKKRRGTLSNAIDAVCTLEILDAFEIPHKTKRGRTYLLCPGHDDVHYGSCYVDKNDNGYYCYVCGEHVTKWEMVLKLTNDKTRAREWFFAMSGIAPSKAEEDPYKKAQQVIKQIEVYVKNSPIHYDLYSCEKNDSPYGRNLNGEYTYSEISVSNPLLDLYKADKQVFHDIVLRQLNCTSKELSALSRKYAAKPDDCIYVDGIGPIPNSELHTACVNMINKINALKDEVNDL